MPKHFLNNSKTTLEKSIKRFFWPQNGQNAYVTNAKKVDFDQIFRKTRANIEKKKL